MRLSLEALAAMALGLAAGAAGAQSHEAPIPGKPDRLPWRVQVDDADKAAFVALIGRKGDIARFSTMFVFKTPLDDDGLTYDAVSEAIAVHCPTRRFRREQYETAEDGIQNPPALERLPVDPSDTRPDSFYQGPPPAGSARDEQILIACGDRPLPGTAVTNPYRWARDRFKRAAAGR